MVIDCYLVPGMFLLFFLLMFCLFCASPSAGSGMPSADRRGMGAPRVEGDRPTGAVQHSQDQAAPKVVQFQGQFFCLFLVSILVRLLSLLGLLLLLF